MPLTIVTSFAEAHCDAGYKFMLDCGLSKPVKGTKKLIKLGNKLRSTRLKKSKNPYQQIDPKRIGRAWEIQASEIVVANAEQENWGWADHEILPMLDFWASFEPDARFVLFYTPISLSAQADAERIAGKDLKEKLEEHNKKWRAYNSELLRFYSKNSDRCALINLETALAHPDYLKEKFSEKLDFDAAEIDENSGQPLELSPIFQLMDPALTDPDDDANLLFAELEASADVRGPHGINSPPDFAGILSTYLTLQKEHSKLTAKAETLAETKAERLKQLETEIASKEKTISELKTKLDVASDDSERYQAENELLMLQLEQVQEELEYQFQQAQSASGKQKNVDPAPANAKPEESSTSRTDDITIDLRHFINGTNWHDPEQDGRWAGPGTKSNLRLPELTRGNYEIVVSFVNTMNRNIFENAKIIVNGETLRTKARLLTNRSGVFGQAKRIRARASNKYSPFPAELAGRFKVTNESSNQTEVTLEFPESVSPSESGLPDTRQLTARISQIRIRKR